MKAKVDTATWRDRLAAGLQTQSVWLQLAFVVFGAYLTAVSAQVGVPHPYAPNIPITAQVLAVMLIAGVYRPHLAAGGLTLYFFAGLLGAPWYAGGHAGYRPDTGGYLVGFVLAAPLIAWLLRYDLFRRSTVRIAAAMSIGLAVIYLFGGIQLAAVTARPIAHTIGYNALLFLPFDAAKIAVAAVMTRALQPPRESRPTE